MFSNFRNKYNIIPTKSIILNKILPFFNSKRSHFLQNVLISPLSRTKQKKAAQGHLILHILSIADRQSVLYAANVTTGYLAVLLLTN
jgi:hypothetical protein